MVIQNLFSGSKDAEKDPEKFNQIAGEMQQRYSSKSRDIYHNTVSAAIEREKIRLKNNLNHRFSLNIEEE